MLCRIPAITLGQGRRHQVLFGAIHRLPSSPTPKFSFSSDFDQFILKMLKNAKFSYFLYVEKKRYLLKYHNFWGTSPADFSTAGGGGGRPPASAVDAHALGSRIRSPISDVSGAPSCLCPPLSLQLGGARLFGGSHWTGYDVIQRHSVAPLGYGAD